MEPMMREQINKLCERQEDAMQAGTVVALDPVISALAADIITILLIVNTLTTSVSQNTTWLVIEAIYGVSSISNLAGSVPILVSAFKRIRASMIQIVFSPVPELVDVQAKMNPKIISSLREDMKQSSSIVYLRLATPIFQRHSLSHKTY
jgi:hypothetical protein